MYSWIAKANAIDRILCAIDTQRRVYTGNKGRCRLKFGWWDVSESSDITKFDWSWEDSSWEGVILMKSLGSKSETLVSGSSRFIFWV